MSARQHMDFEQGPIRPPSEAGSFLLRVTRNCPWNKCAFCGTYKGAKFSRRSVEEIKGDIDAAKLMADELLELSHRLGDGGQMTRRLLAHAFEDHSKPDTYRSVASWLARGGETVFLQDANSLMLSTDKLVEVITYLKRKFPHVQRITSYARANTLVSKTPEDYRRLREAGLSRLHVGMESGSDRVLQLIDKGVRSEHLIEGGRRVVEAGFSLCFYIIPGMGGMELSRDNGLESARVVNLVNPGYVRFRSLYLKRGTRLADMVAEGAFTVPNEDDIVREIRLFVENLEGVSTTLVSDHILNLLENIEGKLPEDKDRILAVIDTYLALPEEERLLFQLGRRAGYLSSVEELERPTVKERLREARTQIEGRTTGSFSDFIKEAKKQFV